MSSNIVNNLHSKTPMTPIENDSVPLDSPFTHVIIKDIKKLKKSSKQHIEILKGFDIFEDEILTLFQENIKTLTNQIIEQQGIVIESLKKGDNSDSFMKKTRSDINSLKKQVKSLEGRAKKHKIERTPSLLDKDITIDNDHWSITLGSSIIDTESYQLKEKNNSLSIYIESVKDGMYFMQKARLTGEPGQLGKIKFSKIDFFNPSWIKSVSVTWSRSSKEVQKMLKSIEQEVSSEAKGIPTIKIALKEDWLGSYTEITDLNLNGQQKTLHVKVHNRFTWVRGKLFLANINLDTEPLWNPKTQMGESDSKNLRDTLDHTDSSAWDPGATIYLTSGKVYRIFNDYWPWNPTANWEKGDQILISEDSDILLGALFKLKLTNIRNGRRVLASDWTPLNFDRLSSPNP